MPLENKQVSHTILSAISNLRFSPRVKIQHLNYLDEVLSIDYSTDPEQDMTLVLRPSLVISKKIMIGNKQQTVIIDIPLDQLRLVEGEISILVDGAGEKVTISRDPAGNLEVKKTKI